MRRYIIRAVLAAGTAILTLSCEPSGPTAPPRDRATQAAASLLDGAPRPLYCPSTTTSSTTAVIGPLGGVLSTGGMSVTIPAGGLLDTVTVTLTVPASDNLEIDVGVAGQEHFVFEEPVTITMSYARCGRIYPLPIVAWYFDPLTRQLLQPMVSLDNKLLRTVTFTTPHFSGYILAN